MADRPGRLLLVRHAESEGNRDRTFTPTPDVPITATVASFVAPTSPFTASPPVPSTCVAGVAGGSSSMIPVPKATSMILRFPVVSKRTAHWQISSAPDAVHALGEVGGVLPLLK